MHRSLGLVLAVALALTVPQLVPAAPEPAPAGAPPTDLLIRNDPDGGRTLLLHVEDGVGGTYTYTRAATPPNVPNVREAGAFVHAWPGPDGETVLAAGVYAVSQAEGLVRVPLVLVEGLGASTGEAQARLLQITADAQQQAGFAPGYATEIILPELQNQFATAPSASSASGFRDYPTVYVWHVHRRGPVGEVWVGHYLARAGSVELAADGTVRKAVKDAEVGVVERDGFGTLRLAGAFIRETVEATGSGGERRQSLLIETGLNVVDGERSALSAIRLEDERRGADLARRPDYQRTSASLGVVLDGEFTPLLGLATEQTVRPSARGVDVTRVTSVGPYVDGAYAPVAGARYHSDVGEVGVVAGLLVADGLGSPRAGNFEVDVGPFVAGAYQPVAGLVYRSSFREARLPYQSLLGAGAYTPLGFVPLVVATYDGTKPLLPWTFAFRDGKARYDAWMMAAGTTVVGDYLPLVGVEARGAAPLGEREQQQEFRVGVFAGSYSAFVPVASASFDGERTPAGHATSAASGGGPGARAGDFEARLGAYTPLGHYVPVAGVAFRSNVTRGWAAETEVAVGTFANGEFVPVGAVRYEGDRPLAQSLGNPTAFPDDSYWRVDAGAYAGGEFVPLLRVDHGPRYTRVTPAP